MHANLNNILRKIKGFGSIGGAELHLIIVKEAGLDPRTTEKYSTFLKEQGIIRKGKGQDWIVDSNKIVSLWWNKNGYNKPHSPD